MDGGDACCGCAAADAVAWAMRAAAAVLMLSACTTTVTATFTIRNANNSPTASLAEQSKPGSRSLHVAMPSHLPIQNGTRKTVDVLVLTERSHYKSMRARTRSKGPEPSLGNMIPRQSRR